MRVAEIWQYPVKSMVGTPVPAADLAPTGLVGDRTWAVRDQVRGGIRGAKVLGGLMQLSARYRAGDDATGGAVAIALPDLSAFPEVILEFESPPGTYHDVHPLMIMTTSALRSLEAALPGSNVDVRRFRPSLVVDTGDADGHPERDWIGRRVRIGDTVVAIEGGCPRCVMVTRRIDDAVPQDRTILRHIVRDLGQDVGVYATVVEPGRLAAGDDVELLA